MFPRRLIFAGLVALVVVGLLISGSAASQRDAWMQGYMVGRLSDGAGAGASGAANALPPMFYPGYPGWGGPHFGGFGVLLFLGLIFFVVFVARRVSGHGPWGGHMHGGHMHGGYRGGWGHGPRWWGGPQDEPEHEGESRSEQGGGPGGRPGGRPGGTWYA